MSFDDIMFYSGSVLHERDIEGAGAYEQRVTNLLLTGIRKDDEDKVFEANEEAQRLTQDYRTSLRKILAEYNYRKYLRCIFKRLPNYHGSYTASYLLYKAENNVLRHGRTEFHWHRPGATWIHENDDDQKVDQKLSFKGARHIGGFARTASIGEAGAYGYPASASFIKKTSSVCHFDVMDAAGVPNKIPADHRLVKPNGKESYSNSSSRVLREDMNHFVGEMLRANLGFPVFSVSDCNSFHTSGYLWSTYAIRRVRESNSNDAVVILNFDQHNDVGDAGDDLVASDRWGAPALAYLQNGMYMSFGLAAKGGPGLDKDYEWQNVFVIRKNGSSSNKALNACRTLTSGKAFDTMTAEQQLFYLVGILAKVKGRWNSVHNKPYEATLSGMKHAGSSMMGMHQATNSPVDKDNLDLSTVFAAFWRALSAHLGRPIKYVFVTIDRDSVQGHQTQWGDDSLFPNAGSLHHTVSTVVDALMTEFPGCRLIGLDITGLPESRAAMSKYDSKLIAADTAWQEAEQEILMLRAWGERYTDMQWKPSKSTFLDKAIPLFNSLAKDTLQHNLLYGRNLPVNIRQRIEALSVKLRSDQPNIVLRPRVLLAEQELRDVLTEVAKEMRLAARSTFSREAKGVFALHAERIERVLAG
ncbi:MAG: hypothetical protein IPM54_15605 [Polyangiaceae bacterium]|nr:hypothetical protein [Polyangiaceae bacterium]